MKTKDFRIFGVGGLIVVALIVFIGIICIGAANPGALLAASPVLFGIGAVYTERNRIGDVLFQELPRYSSREEVTVLSGQNLLVGTVLGKITRAIGDAVATAGNTGNGTVGTISMGQQARRGTYTLTCMTAATDGGTFAVTSPDGDALPDAVVGTAYTSPQINFTIADGATDFVVGDAFTIAVSAGSGKVKVLTPAAVDGTHEAYGVLLGDVDASSGDLAGLAIVREGVVIESGLVWPDAITNDQKTAAIAQLNAIFITIRKGV